MMEHARENWQAWMKRGIGHFSALVRLRWTIRKNQLAREPLIGRIVVVLFIACAVIGVLFAAVAGTIAGFSFVRLLPSNALIFLWEGIVFAFMLAWLINLIAELHRGDTITLDRIMHLPISPSHAFALNYLLSLLNLPFAIFTALTFGLVLGLSVGGGPYYLLMAIPVILYLVVVSALTNQFQGWLGVVMSNPRRRRTIMVLAPLLIVVMSQIPALTIQRFVSDRKKGAETAAPEVKPLVVTPEAPLAIPAPENQAPDPIREVAKEDQPSQANEIATDDLNSPTVDVASPSSDQPIVPSSDSPTETKNLKLAFQETTKPWVAMLYWLNIAIPPLWLVGAETSFVTGDLNAVWICVAMIVVSVISFRQNYRATVRYFQNGNDVAVSKSTSRPVDTRGTQATSKRRRLIDLQFPWVAEQTSAVIASTWISIWRAPEFKMQLIAPFIAPIIILVISWNRRLPAIDELQALAALGIAGFGLLTASGITGNQFGHDRSGFRAWVLSPIPRQRILLGRNIAIGMPITLFLALLVVLIGILWRLPFDKHLFVLVATVTMLCPFGLVANLMSIIAPFALPPGSIQVKQFSWKSIVFSLLLSMLMPVLFAVAAAPLLIEWLVDHFKLGWSNMPVALMIELPMCVLSVLLYRWLLPYEAALLQRREIEMLQVVTSQVE